VHGAHGRYVLLDHRLHRSAPFSNVTLQPADESQVGIRVHENLDIKQFPQSWLRQDQDSLHNDHPFGSTRIVLSVRL